VSKFSIVEKMSKNVLDFENHNNFHESPNNIKKKLGLDLAFSYLPWKFRKKHFEVFSIPKKRMRANPFIINHEKKILYTHATLLYNR